MVVNNPFDYAFLNDTKYNLRPGSKNTSWFKNHNQGYDLNGSMTGKISLLYDENICQTVIS
jgi:hypothetical protein